MQAELAQQVLAQLCALSPGKHLRIFKGGGYVAADLQEMLRRAGLASVLRVQFSLAGAHCIVAKRGWASGRKVDLRQVRTVRGLRPAGMQWLACWCSWSCWNECLPTLKQLVHTM